MATGRAGVAANDPGEQIIMNPAAMPHVEGVAAGYFFRAGQTGPSERNQALQLTLMDNTEDVLITGGFFYQKERQSFLQEADFESERIQIGFAGFIAKQVSWGLSVFRYEADLENGPSFDKFDANLGLLWNPTPNFAFGALLENLAPNDREFPDLYEPLDRLMIGFNFIVIPQVRVRADFGRQVEGNPGDRLDAR